jgi:hypothetical protein|tara:strand:- start:460 stop:693 length:234 start_codon:yes stop_codon:yes gene_type:complete
MISKSMRGYIDIHRFKDGTSKAWSDYAGQAGGQRAIIHWTRRYINKDVDFAIQILDMAIKEEERTRNVIKRYNRRFN